MSNKNQDKLRSAIKKARLFLFKISHELSKSQSARLHVSTQNQRKTLIRVLRYIAIGDIPILKNDFEYLKSKKRQSIVVRLTDRDYFLQMLKADANAQIVFLKKLLCVLKQLLRPLFYRDIGTH